MNSFRIIPVLPGLLLACIALLGWSCSEEAQRSLKPTPLAVGNINQLTIIADQDTWEGTVGDTLNYYFSGPYPLLPQPEPLLDLKHFTPEQLNADPLRRELRTYLFIADLSDEDSPATQLIKRDLGEERVRKAVEDGNFAPIAGHDKWASGQLLVYQFANSQDQLIDLIRKNFPAILKEIYKEDEEKIDATVYLDGESNKLNNEVTEKMGIQLRVPNEYFLALSDDKVIWLRKENPKISSNILIYKVKYTDQKQLSGEGLKAIRDSLGKQYITSTEPNSFMRVNDEDLPLLIDETTLDGHYALEGRGIWEIVNDFMGGPFVSYLIHNPDKDELVFLDGFLWAPGEDKRDAMQYLNYILHTARI